MRGFALGGPDHRIRMDFADVENMPIQRGYQGSDYDPNIARHSHWWLITLIASGMCHWSLATSQLIDHWCLLCFIWNCLAFNKPHSASYTYNNFRYIRSFRFIHWEVKKMKPSAFEQPFWSAKCSNNISCLFCCNAWGAITGSNRENYSIY